MVKWRLTFILWMKSLLNSEYYVVICSQWVKRHMEKDMKLIHQILCGQYKEGNIQGNIYIR